MSYRQSPKPFASNNTWPWGLMGAEVLSKSGSYIRFIFFKGNPACEGYEVKFYSEAKWSSSSFPKQASSWWLWLKVFTMVYELKSLPYSLNSFLWLRLGYWREYLLNRWSRSLYLIFWCISLTMSISRSRLVCTWLGKPENNSLMPNWE